MMKKALKEYIDSDPEEILGKKHVETWGNTPGVLIKMIDSKERLTVQVHPDRENSKTTFWKSFWKNRMLAYFKYKRRLRGKAVSLSGI